MLSIRGLILLFLCAALAQAARLNEPAPKFSLKDYHQERHSLADYKGRIVFVNFWASWCAPCLEELPELNRLAGELKHQKVTVLALNVDENQATAKNLLAKLGLKNPDLKILWDNQSKVVKAYDIEAMPSSFILDPRGVIRFVHSGFHQPDTQVWRSEISELLREFSARR